ncbi:diguanylate cyclase [Pseudodesulfovibrio mercurii]|uniref:Diguanylate cyclase n=1 Tax=Pseudodesulfovibrio mercurii TaxID=641491 RepID=F0JFJ5_9BACT|nr:sensor domain-containing diguanylate cyclase [Pseudodesulfovibrio mercurii]EGB14919.1 diguanylate cyclase [Pseudodesulfovibrio mercurii]
MFFKMHYPNLIGRLPEDDPRILLGAIRIFIVLLLIIGVLLTGGGAVIHLIENGNYLGGLRTTESTSLTLQETTIARELDHIVADVLFLSRQNELIRLLDGGDAQAARAMEREYLELADSREDYDQVRYLDADGLERVRVNSRNGRTSAVPESGLRDRSDRYYFRQCLGLDKGGIYLSPMDLNVEDGLVEQPVRPMLRIGTPVFDAAGRKRGIILINYNARTLLDRILRTGSSAEGLTMLLNGRGYWLLAPDETREWGFTAPETEDLRFATERPDEWRQMLDLERGQFRTDNGLFTFATVRPMAEMQAFSSRLHGAAQDGAQGAEPAYFWMLVSQVPAATLDRHARTLLFKLLLGGGLLLALFAFGAWHLSLALSRRRLFQEQLLAAAMFDALTGLPNRKLFFDRLEASLALSVRYDRRLALLYIDLDGFKVVNDTMGHAAGDELLRRVGKLLTGSVRKSDTVARLGGDEFVVMLNEVTNLGDAALVGEKLVSALRAPIVLKTGTATISASVGVSVYPENGASAELLVQKADQAMYASKHMGKSTCTMADSSRCADA